METETVYFIMDIIIMIIIVINTIMIYQNNEKMKKIDERWKFIKELINIPKEESK